MFDEKKIHIIAEIAQGYQGNPQLAELLTTAGISSGADAIKFQLVYADELATPDYQYYELFRSLEMQDGIWEVICRRAQKSGLRVYFDVFGDHSLREATHLKADGVKLSTTEFFNHRLLDQALQAFDTIFVSIGGIEIDDVDRLMHDVLKAHASKICLLYGFQSEPTALEKNNLARLLELKARYPGFKLGFMDHSDGAIEDAHFLGLVCLGAGVVAIEKHLTLDRELMLEDYVSAISPTSFREYARLIRKFETALGSPSLELSAEENEYRTKAAKVVVAVKDIEPEHKIDISDIALKRCGMVSDRLPYRRIEDVIDKIARGRITRNTPVFQGDINK